MVKYAFVFNCLKMIKNKNELTIIKYLYIYIYIYIITGKQVGFITGKLLVSWPYNKTHVKPGDVKLASS